jgi:hypothetical protein
MWATAGEQEDLTAAAFDAVSIGGVFHPVCGSMGEIQFVHDLPTAQS